MTPKTWILDNATEATAVIARDHETLLPEYAGYRERMNDRLRSAARSGGDGIISDLSSLPSGEGMPTLPAVPRILSLVESDEGVDANVLVTIPGLPVIRAFGTSHRFAVDVERLDALVDG